MDNKYLNIVDENDNIIGQETREQIHQEGLLHREVGIYFITPNKEMIFQHRAKDKDTFPNLLDATVGGHVEMGDSYPETAVKETKEETGVEINIDDLVLFKKIRRKFSRDNQTGKINNVWAHIYLYHFQGKLTDLKVEEGKAIGFEAWSMERLKNISETDKDKFIPYIINFVLDNLLDK